jgi:hypothetical protein
VVGDSCADAESETLRIKPSGARLAESSAVAASSADGDSATVQPTASDAAAESDSEKMRGMNGIPAAAVAASATNRLAARCRATLSDAEAVAVKPRVERRGPRTTTSEPEAVSATARVRTSAEPILSDPVPFGNSPVDGYKPRSGVSRPSATVRNCAPNVPTATAESATDRDPTTLVVAVPTAAAVSATGRDSTTVRRMPSDAAAASETDDDRATCVPVNRRDIFGRIGNDRPNLATSHPPHLRQTGS